MLRSVRSNRWSLLGAVVVGLGLLLTSCGDDSSGSPLASPGGQQEGTEDGLRAFLGATVQAYVDVDFEAMHALQDANCDHTLEEVTEGFQQAQAMTMAFTGEPMSEFLDDVDFEIVEYDAETQTATVRSDYVGDNEVFAGEEPEIGEYRFVDGKWTTDDDCLGTAAEMDVVEDG